MSSPSGIQIQPADRIQPLPNDATIRHRFAPVLIVQRRDIAARLIEHYVPLRRSGRQRTAVNADDVGLRVCLRAELYQHSR